MRWTCTETIADKIRKKTHWKRDGAKKQFKIIMQKQKAKDKKTNERKRKDPANIWIAHEKENRYMSCIREFPYLKGILSLAPKPENASKTNAVTQVH